MARRWPGAYAGTAKSIMIDPMSAKLNQTALQVVRAKLDKWAHELGFQAVGVATPDLEEDGQHLERWLAAGYQGDMSFMARHGTMRYRPDELLPGTRSIICVRMDYLTDQAYDPALLLHEPERGYIARYALGRDYHKLMRKRLQQLARRIGAEIGPFGYRALVDSAPVLERALARKAGLGWVGKQSQLISPEGTWFFLGEIFTDLELPPDQPMPDQCGDCTRCLDTCPTGAIVAPYVVDARRCISYLTIEHQGGIPESLQKRMGNRIYGCDDCLLACPWNRFTSTSNEPDFRPREGRDHASLIELEELPATEFSDRMAGSPIHRLGYRRWRRNLAVARANGPSSSHIEYDQADILEE